MSKRADEHGDRMKGYEAECDQRLDPHKPIYARIDGRAFSAFTRGLLRPYDPEMSRAMIETTKGLVEKTHARFGYTQSDEIGLVFLAADPDSDVFFNGRVPKLTSVLASLATALFTREVYHRPPLWERRERLPHFDCRVCQLPDKSEAANMFLWRYKDAIKNSIQMVAQDNFSATQLHGKHGGEMRAMLSEKGVAWEDFPDFFRFGTFARRKAVLRELCAAELSRIPENHRPSGPVLRSIVEEFTTPDFITMADREEFVFGSAP